MPDDLMGHDDIDTQEWLRRSREMRQAALSKSDLLKHLHSLGYSDLVFFGHGHGVDDLGREER